MCYHPVSRGQPGIKTDRVAGESGRRGFIPCGHLGREDMWAFMPWGMVVQYGSLLLVFSAVNVLLPRTLLRDIGIPFGRNIAFTSSPL